MSSGIAYALGAYLLWGTAPLYFRLLAAVPASQILAHRMLWSLAFVAMLLALRRQGAWLRALAGQPRTILRFAVSACLVAANWGLYIWAVNSGHVIDASLGYFINPLVNVMLGALLLQERLRRTQWGAVALALGGVAWLTAAAGGVPWIGLTLAVSFATYGWLRKTAPLGSLEGLALETALLAPFACAALLWSNAGALFAPGASPLQEALLVAAGPVTAIPLLLFAAAARRLPLSTLGLVQYVSPSMQLAVGWLVFGEPFGADRLVGYAAIWVALLVVAIDGLARRPRGR